MTKFLPARRQLRLMIVPMMLLLRSTVEQSHAGAIAQQSVQPAAAFDVVSIKPSNGSVPSSMNWGMPNQYQVTGVPLISTIVAAYAPRPEWFSSLGRRRILGAPAWTSEERYDITAKVGAQDLELWQKQSPQREVLQQMLRQMLAERCKLVVKETTIEVDAYALSVDGHKTPLLSAHVADDAPLPKGAMLHDGGVMVPFARGQKPQVRFVDASMRSFAQFLSQSSSRPIVDGTGLNGKYDFAVDRLEEIGVDPPPAVIWRVKDLGLKLVPTRITVAAVQIEHIERPSEN